MSFVNNFLHFICISTGRVCMVFSVFSSVSIWSWCLKTSKDNSFSWSFSWTNELLRTGISPQEHNRKVTYGFMWREVLLLFFLNISEFSDTWNLCIVNRSLDLLLGPWKSKLHPWSHKGQFKQQMWLCYLKISVNGNYTNCSM